MECISYFPAQGEKRQRSISRAVQRKRRFLDSHSDLVSTAAVFEIVIACQTILHITAVPSPAAPALEESEQSTRITGLLRSIF